MDLPLLPSDKHYFKIGEVASFLKVKPHVLRYWETEFRWLKPEKSTTNQRLYSRKDVELLILVKCLLHDKRYTINGATKYLEECKNDWIGGLERLASNDSSTVTPPEVRKQLEHLQADMAKAKVALEQREAELREFRDKYRRTSIELLQLRKALPDLFQTLSRELSGLQDAARNATPKSPS